MGKRVGRGGGKWQGKGRRDGGIDEKRVEGKGGQEEGGDGEGIERTSCDGDFFGHCAWGP